MKRVIGIIASDLELKDRVEYLYPQDVKNGNIIIDLLDVDLLEKQGQILEKKGAQVIIGRGGGYKLILDTVNIPIIPLNMKIMDLLKAIKLASSYNKKIILILGYDEMHFDYDEFKSIINIEVTEEWFKSKYEIRNKVIKYLDKKDDIIIVGGGIACSFARQYGIDNIFVNASDASIIEAIDSAKSIISTLKEEKFNNEILRNILDGVKDAVLAIDRKGKIIIYNEGSEQIFKLKKSEVFDKYILDIFPCMEWILESLEEKKDIKRSIRHISNLKVNTSAKLIKVDGEIYGVVCIIQDITALQNLERKIRIDLNKKGLYARYTFDDFIYKDDRSKEFIDEAKKIGKTDYTTLLYGESGSGKEMIAQSMHNISNRRNKPFVAINCATISENLLESELFGYEEGAFTGARKGGKPGLFELAHGGTVFLDEINSLPLNFQTKLLRVIEEREIMRIGSDHIIPLDIRIISATNESLREKIRDNTFRSDLFYRLSSLEINIPPLRERKEDIVLLFNDFISQTLRNDLVDYQYNKNKYMLSSKDINKLENYTWPGNVRELRNVAQKYIITGKINLDIENSNIESHYKEQSDNILDEIDESKNGITEYKIDIKKVNRYVEEKIINMLLEQGMSKTKIAEILGISRTALWKKYTRE